MPDADADRDGIDIAFLNELLARTTRAAGALALSTHRTEVRQWTKEASSPVSDADIATNDLIRSRLMTATPDFGWLSEESEDDASRLRRRFTWIVDPIDGTRAYLADREDWCVSIALVDDATPVLAAVFAPVTDEFFFAVRGAGATRNGAVLRVKPGTSLEAARIAGPKYLVEKLLRVSTAIQPHPRIGSLALRLCRVASGEVDAAFAGGHSRDWDLAAADLIVHEAGGRLTGLAGDTICYNRRDVTHDTLVAAGRDRHTDIIARFAQRSE